MLIRTPRDPMKFCPYCAEDIRDAAVVCKHCGRNMPPRERDVDIGERFRTNWKIILIALAVPAIMLALFILRVVYGPRIQ